MIFWLAIMVRSSVGDIWALELQPNVDPYAFAQRHHLRFVDTFMPSFYIFEGNYETHLRDVDTVWAEQQVERRRWPRNSRFAAVTKRLVDDPLWPEQWHLHGEHGVGIPRSPVSDNNGANAPIVIAIVDDGLQHSHPELAANYDAAHSWNFNGGPRGTQDPAPPAGDIHSGHGTSAAAVAVGAKDNGHCGRGVAPNARVAGMRLIAQPVSDLTEAQALSKFASAIRIYSNSWGPIDNGESVEGPGRLVREWLARSNGIYVWASGNGRALGDSCAFDGYAGNAYVNAIGASDYDGRQAWYSEGCSNLLAVAPSSGSGAHGIVTADLKGAAGYDPSECTRSFGGTSSAAPLAAGIIALMLEKRPELTWRDVRHIIVKSAGALHNNNFGFGILRIPALMAALANHTLVPQPQRQYVAARNVLLLNGTGISFVENAILRVWLPALRQRIVLTSPRGTTSLIAPPRPQAALDGWTFSSLAFWGEPAHGQWALEIQSDAQWRLGVFGY